MSLINRDKAAFRLLLPLPLPPGTTHRVRAHVDRAQATKAQLTDLKKVTCSPREQGQSVALRLGLSK